MTSFSARPEIPLDERVWLKQVMLERGAVTIKLESEAGQSWLIEFDHYVAVRVSDESFRLMSVPTLLEHRARVLESRESDFIGWAQAESAGMAGSHPLIHTVVLAAEDIIEVVAFEPAVIRTARD